MNTFWRVRSTLRRQTARALNLFRSGGADRMADRELASHLALLEDEYRRRGLSPEAARREAVVTLGGVEQTKELHRRARSFFWIDDARRDVAYAVRMLRRAPITALAAVLSLALGIGLNAAVFSIVEWVLLRPLPYPSPNQLVRVWTAGTAPVTTPGGLTPPEFERFAQASSLGQSAAVAIATRVISSAGADPLHVVVARVDGDLFATLGVPPAAGRFFRRDEIAAGAPVVVLSQELWRRQFHQDPGIVGRVVAIDGAPHTVVGVMAPNRQFPREAALWRPLTAREQEGNDRELVMIGRLRNDVGVDRASAELATLARGMPNASRTAWAEDVQQAEVHNLRAALNALLASTLLILLIVCANVAALIGARASDRASEMALRVALGATRARLVTQLITEALALAVAGGAIGMLLGRWTLQLLVGMAPVGLPRLAEIALDRRVFAGGMAATLAIGVSVGLVPALRLSHAAGSSGFQPSDWNQVTARSKMRRILVVAQAAMAVMLTIGAGLLGRSFRNLTQIDNGFAVDQLVSVELSLRGIAGDARQLFGVLTDGTESLPGVRSAAVSLQLPTQLAGLRTPVRVVGAESQATATLRPVDAKYFDTIGVPITEGRAFTRTDSQTAPAVAIVNAAFVRDILRGGPAVGIRLATSLIKAQPSIVGVVADVTPAGEPDRAAVYVPIDQVPVGGGFLLLRTNDSRAALSAVMTRIREVAPNLAVDRTQRVAEVLEGSRSMARFNTQLVTVFATLALMLSAVGIYGLTSGEVAARWRELAIRLALGASPGHALWTVVAPCAAVTIAGAALGVVGGMIAAPRIASLLYGVRPDDAATMSAAPALLVAVGLIAAVLASARVLRATPAATLRGE
jgi:putative ABC transport system permease protein